MYRDSYESIYRLRRLFLLSIAFFLVIFYRQLAAQAPAAATDSASGISTNQATVFGTVNANNAQTTVTFQYGFDTGYGGTFEADQSPVSGSQNTVANATLYELEPNTTYHFRVAAENINGTTYGEDRTFTTMELPPIAETYPATNLLGDGATLNGRVYARGYMTGVTFEFGPDTNYGSTVTASPDSVSGFAYAAVSAVISELSTNTTYHYRVVASNVNGTSYGSDMIFTTGAVVTAPTATTGAASNISSNNATLNGTVNANNSQTTVTFEYGPDTNYGKMVGADPSPVSGSVNTSVSADLAELESNTTYHFRITANNDSGTTYGSDNTFTTLPMPPAAVTNAASDVSTTTATLNAVVNANGMSTTVTFQYGLDLSYGSTITADQSPVTGSTNTAVNAAIDGLTNGITYHYRVKATNTGGTVFGEDRTFTTGVAPPTVATGAASNINATSAELNGTVNANNRLTSVTFEYGPDTGYGRIIEADPSTVTGSENTNVSAAISNLTPNTTYHFRIVAMNADGTSYGTDRTFNTGDGPMVTTLGATAVDITSATLNGIVNANNEITTITFEYGLTMDYGSSVMADQSPVSGMGNIAVSTSLTGLTASTTYYYRVVGQNAGGTTYGINKSFTTDAANPDAPTAVTNAALGVSNSGATLSATVNSMNHSTTVTFEYGLTPAYTDTVFAIQSPVTGEFAQGVSTVLTSLIGDTTYHYRVVAENAFGIVYGINMTFYTSDPSPPTVVTKSASSVSTDGAILNGMVNANNTGISQIFFEYGQTASYGSSVPASPTTVSGVTDTPVSQTISGLTNNMTYHFRVTVLTASFTYIYGADSTFTTGLYAPAAITNSASDVGATSAVLSGTVNANNSTVTVSFEYGFTTAYGRISMAQQNPVTGNSDSTVTSSLKDLQPNSTYHYRIVAKNTNTTVYGEDMVFSTTGISPMVTTNAATAVTNTGAILNGMVKANNDNTTVTFEYGLTIAYGMTLPADQSPVTGNSLTPVSAGITGLVINQTYHFRVAAQNSYGTTHGSDMTLYTGAAAPSSTTKAATGIGSTVATINGTVIANNASTTVTFEFGPDTNYGRILNATPGTVSGSQNTNVSAKLTNLSPGSTYHYRVVAINNTGTNAGADTSFTTANYDDTDGDGVADEIEGTGDRDGDGIPDNEDYDPTGYFYNEETAEIISGGQISVNGPGQVTIVYDGSNGYYQFTTDTTRGIYTIGVTLPPGYIWSETSPVTPGAFDPTGRHNPYAFGHGEDGDTGFLSSNEGTQFYLQFDLQADDPVIINNNFPLKLEPTSIEKDQILIPTEYSLSQNFPNPFNPVTTIVYGLPGSSRINLSIYAINGQLVKTLVNEYQSTGYYTIQWDAGDLSSGIYLYRLTTDNFTITKKMMLIK